MFCKNCGNQLNENAAFCPNCGTPTGEQNERTENPMSGSTLDMDKIKNNVLTIKEKFNGSGFDASGKLNTQMEMPRKMALIVAFFVALIGVYISSVGIEMSYKRDDASISVSMVGLYSMDIDDFDYFDMSNFNDSMEDIMEDYVSVGTYLGWLLINISIVVSVVLAVKALLRMKAHDISTNRSFYNHMLMSLCCLLLKYIWFLGTIFIELDLIDDMLEDALDKANYNKSLDISFYVSITYWIFLAILAGATFSCYIWRKEFNTKTVSER